MRLAIISDTHGKHDQVRVPECDVLIHCGDWTRNDSTAEWSFFAAWLLMQPADNILLIHGNHDYPSSDVERPGQYLNTNINILHDSSIYVYGRKFYGSAFTPEFYGWNYMLPRNSLELKNKWEAIPDDTDILITHGPRFGTLDQVGTTHAGCELLNDRVKGLRKLRLHSFGHIHSGYGQTHNGKSVNAALVNEHYQIVNKPILVDL